MSDEIRIDGLAVAPEVFQTIVTVAASEIEGVACVDAAPSLTSITRGKRAGAKQQMVTVADDGSLSVALHVRLTYGQPLHEVAGRVQNAVTDALASMTGQSVTAVEVYIDGVVFPG